MRALFFAMVIAVSGAAVSPAQMGKTTDWWTYAGDAQRTGWEKTDQKFLKEEVVNFRQLWKMKLNPAETGPGKLAAPVILGNLIGSRGFKELAFVQSASGGLWSIDADLARLYWEKHFPPSSESNGENCGGSATVPNLPAPVVFRFRKRAPTPPVPPPVGPSGTPGGQGIPGGGPGTPATGLPAGAPPAPRTPPNLNAAYRVRPIYMLGPDGKLHELNLDDGSELRPAVDFVPAGLDAQSMNIADNVIYTVTQSCGQTPSAVYALDTAVPTPKAVSFSSIAPIHSTGGPAISADGTIYVQTGNGSSDAAKGSYANAVMALEAKQLTVKDYVMLPPGDAKEENGMNITTPVLFSYQGRELVVTAGKDGRLYLLDANSLGGSDHKTPVSRTEAIVNPEPQEADKGIWRNLASYATLDGTRYVLATVWGALRDGFKVPAENGKTPNGSVVAFRLAEENGNLSLTPAWVSHDLMTPDPPVIAQGIVFALSNGKYKRQMKKSHGVRMAEETPANSSHATLYALDGQTGKEMWSTGDKVSVPGSLTGLSIANSRLYFTTVDGTLQVFGKYLETGR